MGKPNHKDMAELDGIYLIDGTTDHFCRVVNGEYDVVIKDGISRVHPKYGIRNTPLAKYVGKAPKGKDYNEVINKFRENGPEQIVELSRSRKHG